MTFLLCHGQKVCSHRILFLKFPLDKRFLSCDLIMAIPHRCNANCHRVSHRRSMRYTLLKCPPKTTLELWKSDLIWHCLNDYALRLQVPQEQIEQFRPLPRPILSAPVAASSAVIRAITSSVFILSSLSKSALTVVDCPCILSGFNLQGFYHYPGRVNAIVSPH